MMAVWKDRQLIISQSLSAEQQRSDLSVQSKPDISKLGTHDTLHSLPQKYFDMEAESLIQMKDTYDSGNTSRDNEGFENTKDMDHNNVSKFELTKTVHVSGQNPGPDMQVLPYVLTYPSYHQNG